MGLLDQLWDETVAGPPPDSCLGRLSKRSSSAAADAMPAALTRSFTVLRQPSLSAPSPHGESSSSVPSSPTTTPGSPLLPERSDGWRNLLPKSKMAGVGAGAAAGPRSPTVFDWVVISSLDR